MDEKQMSDHDLLITLNAKVDMLVTGQNNHLAHHSRKTIALMTVTISSMVAALIAVTTTLIVVFGR